MEWTMGNEEIMDGYSVPTTEEDLRRLVSDESKFHVVGMIQRPNVRVFCVALELRHFPPNTPENDLYELRIIRFGGLQWFAVSVPAEHERTCREVAETFGLRLANGVPTSISGDRIERFPMDGDRVFTLENVPNHPVYTTRCVHGLIEQENRRIEELQREFFGDEKFEELQRGMGG